jgi:DNA polymerase III subunit delta
MSGNIPQGSNIPPQSENSTQILTGEDAFKKRLYLDRLKSRLIGKAEDSFNYIVYNAKSATASDIINSLQTFSITDANRVVVLADPEDLHEDDRKSLLSCIGKPRNKNVFFIMIANKPSSKLAGFINSLPEDVKRVDLSGFKSFDMHSWIESEFKKRKKQLNRKSIELISESTKQDFGKALSVIEQSSLFAGSRENITDDDIRLFLDAVVNSSVSKLLDFINAKSPDKALLVLRDMLSTDSSPVQIIGLLSWYITSLIRVKKLLMKGITNKEIHAYFKIGSYRMNNLISQARGFTLKRLRDDMQELLRTDLMIKTSSVKDDLLTEMLVVKLAR